MRRVPRHELLMKKRIRLCLDISVLSKDEAALKRLCTLLSKLEDKGFLENGQIVFENDEEPEVEKLFNDCYGNV